MACVEYRRVRGLLRRFRVWHGHDLGRRVVTDKDMDPEVLAELIAGVAAGATLGSE